MSTLKSIVTVLEMAKILKLSRSRFYQLMVDGIFPQPLYNIRTQRPMYDLTLQERCIEIRQTGVGENGQYVLFYEQKQTTSPKRKRAAVPEEHKDITAVLSNMGLKLSEKEVGAAIEKLYPQGIKNIDEGLVIRELFRFLRSN